MTHQPYESRRFDLSGLNGISDRTLKSHFTLYEGYVQHTNDLNEKILEYRRKGPIDPAHQLAFSELKRRLGFEYNGMVLHEYYFGNLRRNGGGSPDRTSPFFQKAEAGFGSYENWKTDFVGVGMMRGVGWAVCSEDPSRGSLSNHWITLHEVNHVAGFVPVLVMDVWEHAFMLDYQAAERDRYIEAFFSNIDWSAVDARLSGAAPKRKRAA